MPSTHKDQERAFIAYFAVDVIVARPIGAALRIEVMESRWGGRFGWVLGWRFLDCWVIGYGALWFHDSNNKHTLLNSSTLKKNKMKRKVGLKETVGLESLDPFLGKMILVEGGLFKWEVINIEMKRQCML